MVLMWPNDVSKVNILWNADSWLFRWCNNIAYEDATGPIHFSSGSDVCPVDTVIIMSSR